MVVGRYCAAAALCVAFLSACAGGSGVTHSGAMPVTSGGSSLTATEMVQQSTLTPVPRNAPVVSITEYSNPSYRAHGGITMTNDGSVWWDANAPGGAGPYDIIRMQGTAITATSLSLATSLPFYPSGLMAATANGNAWEDVIVQHGIGDGGQPINDDVLVYATRGALQTAPASGIDLLDTGTANVANLIGAGGTLWWVAPASIFQPGAAFGHIQENGTNPDRFHPPHALQLTAIAANSNGTTTIAGQYPIPQPGMAEFSQSGNYQKSAPLPSHVHWINSQVNVPADNAVWFADNVDSLVGKIASNGSVSLYSTLTPDASPEFITLGGDGALWFTEFEASKIGRITTSGTMTEYTLPTPDSGPFQIVGPSTAGCGAQQIWVAEQRSGKIAELTVTP